MRQFLMIIISFFYCITLNAQGAFGVSASAGTSTFHIANYLEYRSFNAGAQTWSAAGIFAFQSGVYYTYAFHDSRFSLGGRLLYAYGGSELFFEYGGMPEETYLLTRRRSYLSLPVFVKYRLSEGIYVTSGLLFNYSISHKPHTPFELQLEQFMSLNNSDLGVDLSFGFSLSQRMSLFVSGQRSILQINKKANDNYGPSFGPAFKIYNQVVQVGMQYQLLGR